MCLGVGSSGVLILCQLPAESVGLGGRLGQKQGMKGVQVDTAAK